ncbi:MAG: Holliday junction resolvase RuvX [Acidocella sp.]|nr:Holliday junction resolvase RuvX [Acidocella sp.]
MTLFNLMQLHAAMPPGARLIGLDPGSKRIGVALSDVNRQIASPYSTIVRAKLKHNAAEIRAIADEEGAAGLIIGLPLGIDGDLVPAAQAARDWAYALSAATGLPAAMIDESLTTSEVQAQLINADMTRARRAAMVDKLAAAQILQMALDAAKFTAPS